MEKPKRYKLEVKEKESIFDDVMKAIITIQEKHKGERGLTGTIECPKCGNILGYSIAKENGHIWGCCKTEKCLSWMM